MGGESKTDVLPNLDIYSTQTNHILDNNWNKGSLAKMLPRSTEQRQGRISAYSASSMNP